MKRVGLFLARWISRAARLPVAATWSMRVERDDTSANSVATKKPLAATRQTTTTRPTSGDTLLAERSQAHGAKSTDTFLQRRVRAEQTAEIRSSERVDDEHMRHRRVNWQWTRARSRFQFLECVGKRIRFPDDPRACRVSRVFARARDSQLDQRRREWSQDDQQQGRERVVVFVVATSAEQHRPLSGVRQHRDGA